MGLIRPQLLGARELIDSFQRLASAVKTEYIEAALQAGAEVILDSELGKVPVLTGKLRSQIHLSTQSVSSDRIVKTITIGPDGFYWRFLEFGTHWKKRHRGELSPGNYKMRPHPFARQAFKNRKTTATQTIRDTFRDKMLGFD